MPIPVQDARPRGRGRRRRPFFYDTHVGGTHLRVLTVPARTGFAIQVARPLARSTTRSRRIRTFLIVDRARPGSRLAVGLGLLVSRAALAPVTPPDRGDRARRPRPATSSERIDVGGQDELSRLAGSFNTMLAALEDSARAQRQLVADASHELRTPLTSLRTNFEVLMSERELPPDERGRAAATTSSSRSPR